MHFWINKTQSCGGFNGRYVPPSISAGKRRKPMVTPVHRFQSIDVHHPTVSHARHPPPRPTANHLTIGGHRVTLTPVALASSVVVAAPSVGSDTQPAHQSHAGKLKCVVWTLITLLPFIIVTAKYYLNGEYLNTEILVFFIMLIVILLVIGFVSLFEAFGRGRSLAMPAAVLTPVATTAAARTVEDTSPPPYHIAVMLPPPQQQPPPPSYEKAIT